MNGNKSHTEKIILHFLTSLHTVHNRHAFLHHFHSKRNFSFISKEFFIQQKKIWHIYVYRICIIYELFAVVATAMSPWQILSSLFNEIFFLFLVNWMKNWAWTLRRTLGGSLPSTDSVLSNNWPELSYNLQLFRRHIEKWLIGYYKTCTHLICNIVPHTWKKCKRHVRVQKW